MVGETGSTEVEKGYYFQKGVKKDVTNKETFEQRPKGGGGISSGDI